MQQLLCASLLDRVESGSVRSSLPDGSCARASGLVAQRLMTVAGGRARREYDGTRGQRFFCAPFTREIGKRIRASIALSGLFVDASNGRGLAICSRRKSSARRHIIAQKGQSVSRRGVQSLIGSSRLPEAAIERLRAALARARMARLRGEMKLSRRLSPRPTPLHDRADGEAGRSAALARHDCACRGDARRVKYLIGSIGVGRRKVERRMVRQHARAVLLRDGRVSDAEGNFSLRSTSGSRTTRFRLLITIIWARPR